MTNPMTEFNEYYKEVFPDDMPPVFYGANMEDVYEAELRLITHYVKLMREITKE